MAMFFILLAFANRINAQTCCVQISVGSYLHAESGSSSYYGVWATLNQSYDQDLTVYGQIYRADRQYINNFSVTVPAGETSIESSSWILEVPTGSSVLTTITSVTPNTLTKDGVTYVTELVNYNITIGSSFSTLSNNYNIDTVGKWHNDALDYLYTRGAADNLLFTDANLLSKFNGYYADFLASKGVTMNGGLRCTDTGAIHPYYAADLCELASSLGYSASAQTIICSLETSLNNYYDSIITLNDFVSNCNSLQTQSQNLTDLTERKIIGGAISVAKSSNQYWSVKFNDFVQQFSGGTAAIPVNFESELFAFNRHHGPNAGNLSFLPFWSKPKIPWAAIGQADICGALRGGSWGAVAAGGVPGAIAGGIMGAGIGSGIRVLTFAIFKF